MNTNKFFNDSANTNAGKPKFMPPQKRHLLETPKETQPLPEKSPSEKVNVINSPNTSITEIRKPGFFSFKRNCKSFLSPWGLRHVRTGYLEKNIEDDEKTLFSDQKNFSEQPSDNVANYDHLEVDLHNKTDLELPQIIEKFEHLNLSPYLMDNIHRLGYQKLTIIQRYAIAIIKDKINLMACSQTGSGKTASFLIPMIQDLLHNGVPTQDVSAEEFKKNRKAFPIALVLAPTRELALQIYNESRKFCHLTGILTKAIYGGKDPYEQHRDLVCDGCDILIATPGRLIDFMDRFVNFNHLKFIVLDEADKMLDMGFEPQIRDIIARCMQESFHKENIHLSMFSATFPKQVKNMAEEYLKKYVYIGIGNEGKTGSINSCISQELIDVRNLNKNLLLFDLISKLNGKLLIFCATKRAVSNIYNYLNSKNLFVSQIHGDLNQKEREAELHVFKNKCSIMIATDVASRGLDIPDVACVINYDLPTNVESYIHRIGRTGRIGKVGKAISFIDVNDEPMFYKLYLVLQESKNEIPQWFQGLAIHSKEEKDRAMGLSRSKKHHSYNRRHNMRYNKEEDNMMNKEGIKLNGGNNVYQSQRNLENQENRGGFNENFHMDE